MAIIVTENNCLNIDGSLIPKNVNTVSRLSNGVRLSSTSGTGKTDIPIQGTTIDGNSISSIDQLFDFFKSQGFSDGGGSTGEGVQSIIAGNNITITGSPANPIISSTGEGASLPTGTDKDVLSWDDEGNPVSGRITAWQLTDIAGRPPFSFGVLAGASLQTDNPLLLFREASSTPKEATIPMWKIGGRFATNNAIDPEDAINLGQINGFVRSASYNASAYEITLGRTSLPDLIISLPIESLISNVVLSGSDLIFTFEGGAEVTIPLNTLLVGVVKNVNGKSPDSNGRVDVSMSDVIGLVEAINGKAAVSHTHAIANITGLQAELNKVSGMPIVSTVSGWRRREYVDRIEYYRSIPIVATVGMGGARYHTVNTGIASPSDIVVANADESFIWISNGDRTVSMEVHQFSTDRIFRVGMFNNYHESASIDVNATLYIKLVRYK